MSDDAVSDDAVGEAAAPPTSRGRCHNCEAPLHGPFCSACGQRDRDPGRPLWAIIREFLVETFVLDGRLATTLRALFTRPGLLTAEFRHGRRARYTSPLRLYLAMSVLAFSSIAIRGCVDASSFDGDTPMLVRPDVQDGEVVPGAEANGPSGDGWGPRLGRRITDQARRFAQLTPTEQRKRAFEGMTTHVPRMLFLAVPIFALLVEILLWRRAVRHTYVDCLVFGLHVHALWFVVVALTTILPDRIGDLLVLATMIHTTLALRRAFELSWAATWWRALLLAISYGITLAIAVSAAFLITIISG